MADDYRGLGKLQRRALSFARRYNEWHSIDLHDHGVTLRVIKSLWRRGLVEVNAYNQFRAV